MKKRSHGARIKEQLLVEIRQSSCNDRLPPEILLARKFGVNRLTVNKVMAELSREGYVRRVRGKGTFVTSPDRRIITSRPARRKLAQIVIAYPDYFSFDLWSKVNCAEDLAHRNEVELVNIKMNRETAYESVVELIKQKGSDIRGAIVVPPASIVDTKTATLLNSLGVPLVLLAACDRSTLGENVIAVHRDYVKEGYIAMERLIRAGHRKLGYIFTEPWNLGSRLQYQGVKSALYEHGLNLKDLVRSPNGIESWENGMVAGYEYTRQILKKNTLTGIMYRSSVGAIGGLRAIAEAGLRAPDDLSIVSAGEGSLLDQYMVPPLTNVVVDYPALLGVAFDVILNPTRRNEKQIVVDVKLIERSSVRAIESALQTV